MIEEQFVSFETAKLLKDAGFDVPCRGIYRTDRTGDNVFREYERNNTKDDLCWNSADGFQYEYLAPTQDLAARWLREVYNLHVTADPFGDFSLDADGEIVDKFTYWGYIILNAITGDMAEDNDERFDNYEEAFEAGLQKAIKLADLKLTKGGY